MTAAAAVRCDYCHAEMPAAETFHPFSTITRCRDTVACERRQTRIFDPTIPPDDELPVPPPAVSAPGAACAVCGAGNPEGGLFERLPGQWYCQRRGACEQRSVDVQFLHPWSDSSPDRLISAAGLRGGHAAAGAEIPPERVPVDTEQLAILAARDALGRRAR